MSKPMKLILKEYEKELMIRQPIQSYIFQDYTVQNISQYTQPVHPSYFPTHNEYDDDPDYIPMGTNDPDYVPSVTNGHVCSICKQPGHNKRTCQYK